MANLGETARDYEPEQVQTVADLEFITLAMQVKEALDVEFPYSYLEFEGKRYKVPKSVVASIKDFIAEDSSFTKFKVKKSGEGLKTKYTVIPLSEEIQVTEEKV